MVEGVIKPFKAGGYSDSGADIAFALRSRGVTVLTPEADPKPARQSDWVWPDTPAGMHAAMAQGATVLWANTVLFSGHPILDLPPSMRIVGQHPDRASRAEDKFLTNGKLLAAGLPVAPSITAALDPTTNGDHSIGSLTEQKLARLGFEFPLVIKPIRGRGSHGVQVVPSMAGFHAAAHAFFATPSSSTDSTPLFGSRLMIEPFLPGEEFTVTAMPPGLYQIEGREVLHPTCWALPPVRRFSHRNGVTVYSGIEAVALNSELMSPTAAAEPAVLAAVEACIQAADVIGALAPARVDCRLSRTGTYLLFDFNTKPNLTGPGRPGRDGEDSLVSMAARAIGWDYPTLLLNIFAQSWRLGDQREATSKR